MPFIGTWKVWFGFALLCSPPTSPQLLLYKITFYWRSGSPAPSLPPRIFCIHLGGREVAGGGAGCLLWVDLYRLWEIIASGFLPDSNQSRPDFFQVGGTAVSAYSHGWLKNHPVSFWLEKHLSKAAFRHRKDWGTLAERVGAIDLSLLRRHGPKSVFIPFCWWVHMECFFPMTCSKT